MEEITIGQFAMVQTTRRITVSHRIGEYEVSDTSLRACVIRVKGQSLKRLDRIQFFHIASLAGEAACRGHSPETKTCSFHVQCQVRWPLPILLEGNGSCKQRPIRDS